VASNTLEEVRGFHECYDFTPANPDLLLDDVDVADYDAILFTGSDGNSVELHSDPAAHRVAQDAAAQGKVLAAAGDGPVILAKAGVLEGKTVTVMSNVNWYGITDQWVNAIERRGAIYTGRSPVRDGLLVTADFIKSPNFTWGIIEAIEEQ
jgi:protease I